MSHVTTQNTTKQPSLNFLYHPNTTPDFLSFVIHSQYSSNMNQLATISIIFGLIHNTKGDDCNYVGAYKVVRSIEDWDYFSSSWPAPIGVCMPGDGLTIPLSHSGEFICVNGAVSYIEYNGSTICASGTPTNRYHVNYTDAECTASKTCGYLQFKLHVPTNTSNPSCDAYTNRTLTVNGVTKRCFEDTDVCFHLLFYTKWIMT